MMMNDRKLVHNFKSYLGLEDSRITGIKEESKLEELSPVLLAGELVIGVAHNVLLYAPVSEQQRGRLGSLFVTNYKLSFITSDEQSLGGCQQKNYILGPHDVTLSMVGAVMELTGGDDEIGTKSRRRPLKPSQPLPRRIQGLQILCKNMRILSFGFKFSPVGQGRIIAASLLHHAFPRRHHLLFAYEYKEPYHPINDFNEINMFERSTDWKREMDRTNCQNWRISRANGTPDGFYTGAGESLVVPGSVMDYQLSEAARHFRKGRVPIWVWSAPDGAVLVRSGELAAGSSSQSSNNAGAPAHIPESTLLEAIRRTHPSKTAPRIISLNVPSLNSSYKKLVSLCAPNTLRNFWEQDNQFYSGLDSTRWMRYVSEYLTLAAQAAESISDNVSVVLQEGDGMDYCALVSSLAQLLLDSHFRTIKGFQSLIQKDWIALGHPFSDRLGHVVLDDSESSDSDKEMAPVFLLFLDCCWQLINQFPTAFQFTDIYLITLWDSAHNQIFDTFLFNSPRDREIAKSKSPTLRPVWDWHEQFDDDEIQYFYNPLFKPPAQPTHSSKNFLPTSAIRLPGLASPRKPPTSNVIQLTPAPCRLIPQTSIPTLEFWKQCYLRWLPPLHLPVSGHIQYLLHHMRLCKEINGMQDKISDTSKRQTNGTKDEFDNCTAHPYTVGAFFPFVGQTSEAPNSIMPADMTNSDQEFDTQSIITVPD